MIDYAIKRASELPFMKGQKRLFAVILDKKNRIVCEASNSYSQTHTAMFRYGKRTGNPLKCYLHAEVHALLKDKNRRGVKMIVARVDSKGKPCLAAPCSACQLTLKEASYIKSIEFTV